MTLDRDIELAQLGRTRSLAEGSSYTMRGPGRMSDADRYGPTDADASARPTSKIDFKGRLGEFVDSFRREEPMPDHGFDFRVTDADANGHDGYYAAGRGPVPSVHREHQGERYYDLRAANTKTASTLLARELKGRHLQMIAIGGSIGTGLFVASGKALSEGGPASVLLAYIFVGVMLYFTVQALGELAVVFPVAGSFSAFSTRFLDPSWGFAMGWK